jgi:hypothetical protein
MNNKYTFTGDIFSWLGEPKPEEPKEGLFSPKSGKPEAPVAVDPARDMAQMAVAALGGEDAARKAMLNPTTLGPNDYSDLDDWTVSTVPFLPQYRGDVPAYMALEIPPVTTTELGPDMDTMAMQDAQEQAAIRSASGITESLGRPAPAGLMSPPVQDTVSEVDTDTAEAMPETTETADDTTFVSSFVDLMGTAEGTEDHQGSEDQFTYAYGILPATADSYGLNADDFENRRDFAEAVYAKMYEDAKTDYADTFDGLTTEEEKGVLSLYINLGKLPTGVVNALSGETKDFDAAKDSLASVVHYTNKTTKVKYASKGLSVRRASEYNTLRGSQEGFEPVATVSVTGTKAKPVFNWLDESGSTIKSFASSKTLSPDNSMKTTAVN